MKNDRTNRKYFSEIYFIILAVTNSKALRELTQIALICQKSKVLKF